MDNGLAGLLGLCRRAGKAALGEEPVITAVLGHKARVVLVASDAAENTRTKMERVGEQNNATVLSIPLTKAELGFAFGRASCAVAALTDMGMTAAVVKKLSQLDPETYGDTAEAMGKKAAKQDRRRREQRAKEKARQAQSRKPWVAPPSGEGRQ